MRNRSINALWLLVAGLAVALAGCVYHPSYEGTSCAAGGGCPSGHVCNGGVCVHETPPDGGPDGTDADAADDGDAGPDGVDEQPDGADEQPDGADEEPDGTDEQPDGADEQPDGADGAPCPDGCLPSQYCDEATDQCKPCEDSTHCGWACLPCDNGAGETCQNLGADGFCCLGPCDFAHACQRRDCNGTVYLCLAAGFQQPITYSWVIAGAVGRDLYCALADQDGMLPERRCAADSPTLLVNCPWDGKCEPGGTCQLDPTVLREHACGAVFGCQDGACGLHFQDGQACLYNFDCASYCCSRAENATCLPAASAEDQCKARNARYYDGGEPRCFRAWDANDPHDMGAWSSDDDWGIDCASGCGSDRDCDSGDCGDTLGGKRCWISACGGNEGDIRGNYFCASGDSAGHLSAVTNGAAEPATPPNCVY
ncbi:MAG TPA: hypothetical protein PK668_18610 [Myxococcota bacterium]|nr:hypothetical protein [Myxococcota bacterium]HRY96564.1 hypothetical protein [Myxococcota bacterium]HSA22955.1 hypothetical protein [Myxococcota bacterium]